MPNIGDPLTSDIPLVGSSGTAYATAVNEFLEEVKERLEASVPLSSIDIGELDMANNDILNAHGVGLYPQASATSDTGVVQNIGGDLYWISTSGAVQITTGADINASGIGGITGDYGGVDPAQLRFVGADQTYYFYDDYSTGAWAYTRALGVEITGGATSLNRVRINWGGSSSYTLTLPTTVPSNTSIVQMSSAGVLTATNTLASGQSITLQGSGIYKHADHVQAMSPIGNFANHTGTVSTSASLLGTGIAILSGGSAAIIFIRPLKQYDRLKSIRIVGSATVEPTSMTVFNQIEATATSLFATKTGTMVAGDVTLTLNTALTISDPAEFVFIWIQSSSSDVNINSINFTYDRP